MKVEIKVPSPGESISEVQIAAWLVEDGDYVEKDQDLVEIDSDKATLSIPSDVSGLLYIKVPEGETVSVGSVIATIDTESQKSTKPEKQKEEMLPEKDNLVVQKEMETKKTSLNKETPVVTNKDVKEDSEKHSQNIDVEFKFSPLAKKILKNSGNTPSEFYEFLKKVKFSKDDVASFIDQKENLSKQSDSPKDRNEERVKMSTLRKKISKRLVEVKNQTAMLTTFNEVDMSEIIALRNKYKAKFVEKHNVRLGFMSFFTKAACIALKEFKQVNSSLDGEDIVSYNYCDIGIAVSAPKGLVVPIIRNAETLSLADIEIEIKTMAEKARANRLSLDEMTGGTFTITNGGLFGSMLSTPILNPPQSAILGMHNIVERPVVDKGEIVIRPIMYLALSYDHRIIDGKDSVGFLVRVKELLEKPEKLLLEGKSVNKDLLKL
ncbi:MAG: 2-oxoglutarate dehydrogenase complex dihydrolipoyllysine-residue succinyltransferase [Bacteroidales bacterium]